MNAKLAIDSLVLFAYFAIIIFIAGLVGAGWMYRTVPTSFVPNEDVNYYITQVQTPEGSSLDYTSEIANRAAKLIAEDKNAKLWSGADRSYSSTRKINCFPAKRQNS